ncbi:uncharacterized protein [Coffea arabica]|uniref:Uncharacterized protein n=1 Tax=Coffea arabica TaxID=13443 RepID=A0ABM4WXT9_COFAR
MSLQAFGGSHHLLSTHSNLLPWPVHSEMTVCSGAVHFLHAFFLFLPSRGLGGCDDETCCLSPLHCKGSMIKEASFSGLEEIFAVFWDKIASISRKIASNSLAF